MLSFLGDNSPKSIVNSHRSSPIAESLTGLFFAVDELNSILSSHQFSSIDESLLGTGLSADDDGDSKSPVEIAELLVFLMSGEQELIPEEFKSLFGVLSVEKNLKRKQIV